MKPNSILNIFRLSLDLLATKDRNKFYLIAIFQSLLSFLDLIGVALIGLLGAIAVTGVGSRNPSDRTARILILFGIENLNIQTQALILGLAASIVLIGKSILAILFNRAILYFFSQRGAKLSTDLTSAMLSKSLQELKIDTLQEKLYSLTTGVNAIFLGILATGMLMIADLSLLIIMFVSLATVDLLITLVSVSFFIVVSLALYKYLHKKSQDLGEIQGKLNIQNNQTILESLANYRELVVKNQRGSYINKISTQRLEIADILAEISFLPSVSKYVMEVAIVIGTLTISAIQFWGYDAAHSVGVISVFLAASSRISPAILRLQQGAITVKNNIGISAPTFALINQIELPHESQNIQNSKIDFEHLNFEPTLIANNICIKYPNSTKPTLKDISLSVEKGEMVSIVGPTGSGKSTLVDSLLGLLRLESGEVLLSNMKPIDAYANWPGAVGYVPQEVIITNGTIRDNVLLGFGNLSVNDSEIWSALKMSGLDEFVDSLPLKLDSHVGDGGNKLSGGQRQRLGIARSLLTRPKLLIFDEATSALDATTEKLITDAILNLKGKVTVVFVAHRLSTVKHSDNIIYLENGQIKAQGNFESLRNQVPDFDKQAKLFNY